MPSIKTLCIVFVTLPLFGCGGGNKAGPLAVGAYEDAVPYDLSAPYAPVLKQCVSATSVSASCTLETLPPLGMESESPSIDEIMGRVVTSHTWMAQRFHELLQGLPTDIHQLAGGVTAIVIDSDIRPSYYWSLTGAIYLDPADLWLTQEERAVISRTPDYRSAYVDPMAFRPLWRYTKNSADAYSYVGQDGSQDRALEDIIVPMAALLFHELAHANDILPPSAYASVDTSRSIAAVTSGLYELYPSTALTNDDPPLSNEMFHLANILYRGFNPSTGDKQITGANVGGYFAPDNASDDYGYVSQYEDLAMLFEESMMKLHFDIDRDMAFATNPIEWNSCNDLVVEWGIRNRIAAEQVSPRAQWVTERLLPASDHADFFASLDPPAMLAAGTGWCASINLAQPAYQKGALPAEALMPLRTDHTTRPYRIMY